jgi:hypothetical protein
MMVTMFMHACRCLLCLHHMKRVSPFTPLTRPVESTAGGGTPKVAVRPSFVSVAGGVPSGRKNLTIVLGSLVVWATFSWSKGMPAWA